MIKEKSMIVNQYPSEDDSLLISLWEYIKSSGNQKLYNQVNKHIDMLELHGLEMNKRFKRKSFKQLDKDLYELRPDNVRITFTIDSIGVAWLLTWFKKESDETPPHEIDKARKIKNKLK
jgi:phage-related protein